MAPFYATCHLIFALSALRVIRNERVPFGTEIANFCARNGREA